MDLERLTRKIVRKAAIGLIGTTLAMGTLGLSGCYSTGKPIQDTIIQQPSRDQGYFFACNYWEDVNHDGLFDYPTEFIGIKTVFKDTEEITVVGGPFPNEIGQTCKIDILSPRGEFIDSATYIFDQPNGGVISLASSEEINKLVSEFGHGTYCIAWYLDNKIIANTHFSIIPSE